MPCQEPKIPVLTVTKNGMILKNIVIQPSASSTPIAAVEDGIDKGKEESLTIGRHPDCNILLNHPSVSRFHLRIDLNPFSLKVFVTDLDSVHGTWVRDEKIESKIRVELNEGDALRVGISTRVYTLHWVSRNSGCDMENLSLEAVDLARINEAIGEENDIEMSQEEVFVDSDNIVADGNGSSLGAANKEETSSQEEMFMESEMVANVNDLLLGAGRKENSQDIDTFDEEKQSQLSDSIWEAVVSLFSGECCYGNIEEQQIVSSPLVPEEIDFPASHLALIGKENSGNCDWTVPSMESIENLAIREEVQGFLITEASPLVPEEKDFPANQLSLNGKEDSGHCNRTVLTVENIENLVINEVEDCLIAETPEETKCLSSLSEDGKKTDNYTLQEALDHSFVVVDLLENNNSHVEEENRILKAADDVHQIVPSIENIVNSMITEEVGCLVTETLEEARGMISISKDSEKTDNVTLDPEFDIPETNICHMTEGGQTLEAVDGMLLIFLDENLKNSSKCSENELESPNSECLDDQMVSELLVKEEKLRPSRDYYREIESEGGFFFASLATDLFEETGCQSSLNESTKHIANISGIAEADQVKEENQTQQLVDLHTTYPETNLKICIASSGLEMLTRLNVDDLGDQTITSFLHKEETSELPREGHRQTDSQSSHNLSLATESENLSSSVGEVKSETILSIESLTPRTVLLTSKSSDEIKTSQISSEKKTNTPNIYSRRDNTASDLDLQINSGAEVPSKNQKQLERTNKSVLKPLDSGPHASEELFSPNKENYTPNTVHSKSLRSKSRLGERANLHRSSAVKKNSSPSVRLDFDDASDKEKINFSSADKQKTWTMMADTSALLVSKSRKALQLLQGLKGTQLIIPLTVVRDLLDLKFSGGLFRSNTEASLSLEWIEECSLQTCWWIHLESSTEVEDWLALPSLQRNTLEKSPTSEDQLLDYALHCRKMHTKRQLVLLSNDVTMKIKAISEGIICETAQEFRDSLVNPFTERFLWTESSPRGLTWSVSDDEVLKEAFYSRPSKMFLDGKGAKGLKLILQQDCGDGRIRQPLNAISILTGILLQAPLW